MYREITRCRLCGTDRLDLCLELGEQYLTGVFPKTPTAPLTRGPLTLVRCADCGLVQLRHSYNPTDLYGDNYGYRSGLNRAMVEHLRATANMLRERVPVRPGSVVVDIGSNDGTTLSFYAAGSCRLIGFDPSAARFQDFYREDIRLITDFFSAERFRAEYGPDARAHLVTSLAMFYDLEDPLDFMRQIEALLADDGVWHFEQSYLPAMLERNAYDTICHEHLEYYAAAQIQWMADRAGLRILDITRNDVNGGSFAVTVAKRNAPYATGVSVGAFLRAEAELGLDQPGTYAAFQARVFRHREELLTKLHALRRQGRLVFGYGASTKGNVILQFCHLDKSLIPCIAEINEHKFGCFTPGTGIPIVSEREAKAQRPDFFLVLPWHFRNTLIEREREFLQQGGTMLFPLPQIEETRG